MRLDVRHPARASWIPMGGRKAVDVLVPAVTPCEIHRVTSGSERRVAWLGPKGEPFEVVEHGGRLWRPMVAHWYGLGHHDVTPDDLAGFMEGSRPADDRVRGLAHRHLRMALAMTPLVGVTACGVDSKTLDRGTDPEGGIVDPGDASAEVAAFVANEILVTGNRVLLRHRPVAEVTLCREAKAGQALCHGTGEIPFLATPGSLPLRRGRAARDAAHALGIDLGDGGPLFAEQALALRGFPEDDEDLRLMANRLPCIVHSALSERRARPERRPDRPISALHARIAPLRVAGMLGSIRAEDAAASLGETCAVMREMDEATELRIERARTDWSRLADTVMTLAARVSVETCPEDDDALAGLVPR